MTPHPCPTLLPDDLAKMFIYWPDTGDLIWNVQKGRARVGDIAGTPDGKGRLRIEISGKTYMVHHICFALFHGKWPSEQVDHINQNKTDNRITNLREASNAENSRNRKRAAGKAGYKGVTLHKGKYISRIMMDGKVHNLGSFDCPKEAHEAYCKAAEELHGEFSCTNS